MDPRLVALDETWTAILALLDEVTDEQWAWPTPCSAWTVRDLASHLGAVEGQFQSLPQPETPAPEPSEGIDGWTAAGVEARRRWSPAQVRAEIVAASSAQIAHLATLEDAGWQAERFGPLGPTTEDGLARIRVFDVYLHLLDLRAALGRPLGVTGDDASEPTACRVCVDRVFEVTPWGAAKKAGLADGARVRLDLSGPGGRVVDVVVEGGKARLEPGDPDTVPPDVVSGSAVAYLLTASGRVDVADVAGGLTTAGTDAARLVSHFRMFS